MVRGPPRSPFRWPLCPASPPAPERAPRLAELAAQVAANHPSLMRVGLFGSYGLMPTTTEHAEPLASSSAMAAALQGASRFLWQG